MTGVGWSESVVVGLPRCCVGLVLEISDRPSAAVAAQGLEAVNLNCAKHGGSPRPLAAERLAVTTRASATG